MKICGLALFVFCLTSSAVLAQNNPTVEIVLSQPTAHLGETITADVYVRNATNVGGLDVGINVDDQCLRIVDRQPGSYLPTTEAEGAFSALSELNQYDTRLAAALLDRTKFVSGDGVFYRVQLEVMCAEGTASLNFTYAQVSVYVDPTAEIIDVISYDLDKSTLNSIKAQLTIEPTSVTTEVAPTSGSVEDQATIVPTTVDGTTSSTETVQNPIALVVILALTVFGLGLLGIVFWLSRRSSGNDDQS